MASTPETLTAASRAERLNLYPPSSVPGSQGVSKRNDKYTEMARQSLNLGATRNATAKLDPHADADMSFAEFDINDLALYEHNPRTGPNPKYDEIKASIRADHITNMITRRPGAMKYTPYGISLYINLKIHINQWLTILIRNGCLRVDFHINQALTSIHL